MNKKILIFCFILLVLVSGCTPYIDVNKEEREELMSMLLKADNIDECKSISEKIIELGPECSPMGYNYIGCADLEQFYTFYMTYCIGSIAAKKNNQSLCLDNKTNEEICVRYNELMGELYEFDFGEPSQKFIKSIEKSCLLRFLTHATLNTTITIDCNSFITPVYRNGTFSHYYDGAREDCFRFLATAKQDPNICLNISNKNVRGRCMYYFAFRNHNKTLCNYSMNTKGCEEEYNFIEKIDEISDCDTVSSNIFRTWVESCYLDFAIYNRDPSICSKYDKGPFIDRICERYTR